MYKERAGGKGNFKHGKLDQVDQRSNPEYTIYKLFTLNQFTKLH